MNKMIELANSIRAGMRGLLQVFRKGQKADVTRRRLWAVKDSLWTSRDESVSGIRKVQAVISVIVPVQFRRKKIVNLKMEHWKPSKMKRERARERWHEHRAAVSGTRPRSREKGGAWVIAEKALEEVTVENFPNLKPVNWQIEEIHCTPK